MTQTLSQIDLKNANPKVIYVPPKIILYGRNGIGKSRFALKAPNPIFLDLDENIYELPITSNKTLGIPIKTYEDVMAFFGILFNQDHEFKTLVVDSLSSLEKLVIEKVLKDSNKSSLASFQYGQGYQKMMPLWEDFLQKLKNLWEYKKIIIILLAHFKEKREENLTGASYLQYKINLYEKASELLRNWCSCVLFADDEIILEDEAIEFNRKISKVKNSTRVIHTDGGTTFLAKNTYNLPPKLPLDWNVLFNHIQAYYKQFNQTTTTEKGE
ncbi:MAG: ATP-binding protein [Alphaproteobacteria bacterium]